MARRRQKFNSEFKQAAEIFGNLGVAWFSAGVIIPIFGTLANPKEFFPKLIASLGLSGIFFYYALEFARRGKK